MTTQQSPKPRVKDGVRNTMTDTLTCPYCGSTAKLVDSAAIYRGRSYGPAWVCANYPKCDAYVGCHPNSEKPLGRLADAELRHAKMAAHKAFDRLWKIKMKRDGTGKKKARGAGYRWLADQLGIDGDDCHIGMFDVAMCRRVVGACAPHHGGKSRPAPARAAKPPKPSATPYSKKSMKPSC